MYICFWYPRYLLSVFNVPGTVLVSGEAIENKTKSLPAGRFIFWWEKRCNKSIEYPVVKNAMEKKRGGNDSVCHVGKSCIIKQND